MDKPAVQVKLTIEQLDSIRAMIQRDHAAAVKAIDAGQDEKDMPPLMRQRYNAERLAEVFSVTLDQ